MRHFILFFQVISFAAGFGSILSLIFIYLRYRTRVLKVYLFFLVFFSINSLLYLIDFYRMSILPGTNLYYSFILITMINISFAIFFYFFLLLLHDFFEIRYSVYRKLFTGMISGSFMLLAFIPYFFSGRFISVNYYVIPAIILAFLVELFSITEIAMRYNMLKPGLKKNIVSWAVIIMIVGIILNAMQASWKFLMPHPPFMNFGSIAYTLIFIVNLCFCVRYLSENNHNDYIEPAEKFFSLYNISDREKEILKLVAEGMKNRDIAAKLFISPATVRNHIHNLFQKTGVNSRVEIIKLLSNSK